MKPSRARRFLACLALLVLPKPSSRYPHDPVATWLLGSFPTSQP